MRGFFHLVPAAVLCGVVVSAQDALQTDAARMREKVEAIVERGEDTATTGRIPLRTHFTDREVNAYFKVDGPEFLPPGVIDPEIAFSGGGKLRARAIVDLELALQQRERSAFDPLSWLGGKTEVTLAGTMRTARGTGELTLEEATLAGVSVPPSLVQQLVGYYTRTPEAPEGFPLDEPFDLPANISSVEMSPGAAVVVQP